MIECTLEVAATRTRKEGGYFYHRDVDDPYNYHYDQIKERFVDQHGKNFDLQGLDFERVWIYVTPKKSAFQKFWDSIPEKQRKEYYDEAEFKFVWNAAIDAVLDLPSGLEKLVERIKALREP